jgi:hypothetical protein
MDSLWLCVDHAPAMSLKGTKRSRAKSAAGGTQHPILGIFTDTPMNIARRLPRPLTPFVPAPEPAVTQKQVVWDDVPAQHHVCDSPPADMAFSFGGSKCTEFDCGISLF